MNLPPQPEPFSPTPYPELNMVLQELRNSVQAIVGGHFIGMYLQGSFAVGDFDPHSDADWIVVTADELTGDQVDALQAMHEGIYHLDVEWAKHLEGSYFPKDVLRDPAQRGTPLWYLDHGSRSLIRSDHCNTLVVRWVVRHHGVTLAGPAPDRLIDPIHAGKLREEILATMTGWGQEILDQPERYRNRFYQGFIVLNYCRMLHDLIAGTCGSKRTGAEWAKATLDPAWRGLIDRAWSCRLNPAFSVRQPADPEDFKATLELVQTIMKQGRLALIDAQRLEP